MVVFRAIHRGDADILGAVRTLIAKWFMRETHAAAVECGASEAVDDKATLVKKVQECVRTWCQGKFPIYVNTSWTIERIRQAEDTPELWIAEVHVKPYAISVAVDVRIWNVYELRR